MHRCIYLILAAVGCFVRWIILGDEIGYQEEEGGAGIFTQWDAGNDA